MKDKNERGKFLKYLDEYFSQANRWSAEFRHEHHTLEIISLTLPPELQTKGKEKKETKDLY